MDLDQLVAAFLVEPTRENIGALLGFCGTKGEQDVAEERAKHLFKSVDLLPDPYDLVECSEIGSHGARCGLYMDTEKDSSRFPGFRFICRGGRFPHPLKKISPLWDTLFWNSNLPYHKLLKLLICFLHDVPVTEAMQVSKVASTATVTWYQTFRNVMYTTAWHDFQALGGHTFLVELDESFLYKAKYNRGRQPATRRGDFWTFGGICRVTGNVFATVVFHRDRQTLFQLMRKYIRPRTHLCTDGWAPYLGCDQLQPLGCSFASHNIVIHKTNFLFPPKSQQPLWKDANEWNDDVRDRTFVGPYPLGLVPVRYHTQNIERTWRSLKTVTHHGGRLTYFKLERYQGEYMYRHNILGSLPDASAKLGRFAEDIKRMFPGVGIKPIKNRWIDLCECPTCSP